MTGYTVLSAIPPTDYNLYQIIFYQPLTSVKYLLILFILFPIYYIYTYFSLYLPYPHGVENIFRTLF